MNPALPVIEAKEWQELSADHLARVKVYTDPYRVRRSHNKSHPILDFLFTYYSFPIGRLENWHPSLGTHLQLEGREPPAYFLETHYSTQQGILFHDLKKLTPEREKSIRWMITLLEKTQENAPIFGCFGMHEWAMVYQGKDVRHEKSVELRLSQEETDAFVRSRPITCSHFDAYRFFTPTARPFNKLHPEKETRDQFEQPGCIHANMDLYKWAYKCMPWIGSDFLWKTFLFALKMRELDMRAAPYDLSEFGYTPIKVETTAGRQEYERLQRQLTEESKPIRSELLTLLKALVSS